ncbi:IclR family transcriptional regulator [Streptomyces sp. WMMB 322]|uniref:IclR family transcriptional regulator n=1 Tax=Streptomyces sp. WMMB 322 TaxID=1286821 RepID=UPI0008239E56|nr:IclR family transcriptional regulator [Streptomyces sp. WMMB 322]SCK57285.1 transcriptional regulator, IclR family [Streptomyces sp. WMMB 322]
MPSSGTGMRAVITTLRVLETVAELQPVGVSAIARASGIPKSSVHRCLVTLREAEWLTTSRGDRTLWVLTGRALSVGIHAPAEVGLREAALPVMRDLRDETHETIHLSGYGFEHDLIVIDRVDSDEPVRTWVRLGTRVPLHASCSGRAILGRLPDAEVERLLKGPLERFSETTPADLPAVLEDLRRVREAGYATNDCAWRPGVGAVGAALVDQRGRPVGALAVSVPVQRYDAERGRLLGPLTAAAARRISASLPPG